jgi:hypothetical protein
MNIEIGVFLFCFVSHVLTLPNFVAFCCIFGIVKKPLTRLCAHLLVHNFQTNEAKVMEFKMIFFSFRNEN